MTDNELIPSQGRLTKAAWQLPENLSEADWTKAGRALARIEGSISWWLGDWWAYGNHHYGSRKALVESEDWEGPAFGACANAASVCRAFESSRRREVLSFKHHCEVMPIEDPHVQDRFLDWCEEGLSLNGKPRSTRELRQAVREYLDEQGWSEDERARQKRVKAGLTVVANLRGAQDKHLLNWAQFNDLLVQVDRGSKWGNPFEIPDDGDRDTVCDRYILYHLLCKPALANKIHSLKGRVLACWCYPERCHGDYLAQWANKIDPEDFKLVTQPPGVVAEFRELNLSDNLAWVLAGLKDHEKSALFANLKVIGDWIGLILQSR